MISYGLTIGWFGVPGGRTGTKTHIVDDRQRPLCGSRLHPKAEYQWCFPDWRMADPECERCKNIRLGWLIAFNEDKTPKMPIRQVSPLPSVKTTLLHRIKDYLTKGGMFNPELMDHDKVRKLIIDCRDYIEKGK